MRKRTVNGWAALGLGVGLLVTGCGSEEASAEEFCSTMLAFDENDPTEGLEFGSPDYFQAMADAMDDVISTAPGEVKSDMETMRDVMTTAASAAEGGDDASLDEAFAAMDDEAVEAASANIDAYMESNCEDA